MKQKTHFRLLSLLLFALLLGMLPAVFATDEERLLEPPAQPSSVEEIILEDDEPLSEPEQSTIEADEPEDDSVSNEMEPEDSEEDDNWDFDDDWDGPRSDDGAPLTRNQIMLFAAAGSSATVGKSTCVNFPAYTSPYWYCNRYYTDGTHKYGHYFYASTISYHTVDGEYAFCIERATRS